MIIVDTSVWADYFNGQPGLHVSRLQRAMDEEEEIAILPVILTEVLQGFRSEKGFRKAREVLIRVPIIRLSIEGHIQAARLYRSLRKKGITVRGAVDCIIAQACLETGSRLLTPDLDFSRIAEHSPLELCDVG